MSSDSDSSRSCNKCRVIDDCSAEKLLKVWKRAFCDAIILPVIGYPSNSGGVVTITHTMGDSVLLNINGLASKSPLANNALYSAECIDGHYLNLYEIMIPDIPGKCGEESTAEIYVNALRDKGLNVAGVHFHWWGQHLVEGDRGIIAIHHQKIDMDPIEFARKTVKALRKVMKVIHCRANGNANGSANAH